MIESDIKHLRSATKALFWMFLLQGISFILLGVLIILYPEVLFALMSFLFVWIGLSIVTVAWKIRKFNKEFSHFVELE